KEVLLRRIKYTYNKQCLVTKQQVFDASDKHRYTLFTEYDSKGRVSKRSNELGHWFTYKYDENSNKIYEKQDGAGFKRKYEYDKANRLIAEIEQHDDATIIGNSYTY